MSTAFLGWSSILARIFADTISGAKANRPQLAGALDQLRPGDALVVWRLDRLGRSLSELIELMITLI